MDTSRLGRGEMIAGVSAVILFIVMFLGWFKFPDEINGVATGDFAKRCHVGTAAAWQGRVDSLVRWDANNSRCIRGWVQTPARSYSAHGDNSNDDELDEWSASHCLACASILHD